MTPRPLAKKIPALLASMSACVRKGKNCSLQAITMATLQARARTLDRDREQVCQSLRSANMLTPASECRTLDAQ